MQGKSEEERNKISMEKIDAVGQMYLKINTQINCQEECSNVLVLQEH